MWVLLEVHSEQVEMPKGQQRANGFRRATGEFQDVAGVHVSR